MRRLAFIAALVALSCAVGAVLPDTVTKDKVTFARRGALGADSYVVTNIVIEPPSYQLSRVADLKLRDRCVNSAIVEGTNVVFALPGRKTVAGYARTLLVFLDATNDAGCSVAFTGADALFTSDWYGAPNVPKGKRIFSIIEIADNQYLVETRELEEIGKDNQ
ncbi:MAG: hypothetical protein IJI54_01470 [Kiritimatiellae bacterium]|nr:hypothetical protein [Kiritimatiellia bacterium]